MIFIHTGSYRHGFSRNPQITCTWLSCFKRCFNSDTWTWHGIITLPPLLQWCWLKPSMLWHGWCLILICLSIASVFNLPAGFTLTLSTQLQKTVLRSIPARACHFLPLCRRFVVSRHHVEHSCDSCGTKVANCFVGGRTALLLQIPFLTCSVDGCMATV